MRQVSISSAPDAAAGFSTHAHAVGPRKGVFTLGPTSNGRAALFLAAALSAGFAPSASADWTYIILHPQGADSSVGRGVTGGQEAGSAIFAGIRHAGWWAGSGDSWTDLHPTGATDSIARSVFGARQGGSATFGGVEHAGFWDGTAQSWTDVHPAGASTSEILGVNATQQMGWARINGLYRGGFWTGTPESWVDLTPTSPSNAEAQVYDSAGGQQVGWAITAMGNGTNEAALWNGSADTWMNLKPAEPPINYSSLARATTGTEQAGGVLFAGSPSNAWHAGIWHGTAATWTDLHPAGATGSELYDTSGQHQVGYAIVAGNRNASIWSGTAQSWFNLQSVLPASYTRSEAFAIDETGGTIRVAGYAFNSTLGRNEAVLWVQAVPPCAADFNADGSVNSQDFFDFLDAFFASAPAADFNHDGAVNSQDFFDFLTAFFAGC